MAAEDEKIPMDKMQVGDLEDPLAVEYGDNGEELTEHERHLKRMEQEINAKIDSDLARNPNKFPKAVYFILPNELGERLCYYGISPLLNIYLQVAGASPERAKVLVHAWKMATYFCPLLGAAISDSYLGKYKTIVYLSLVYLIGNIVITITSVPHLRSVTNISVGLYLMAVGTGGIKATVSAHGGDQFLKSQAGTLRKFFSFFYMSINIGSLISSYLTPELKDHVHCFGDPNCYTAAFAVPTAIFAIALGVFVYGDRYYRIVPPTGDFMPGRIVITIFDAIAGFFGATSQERAVTRFWQFGAGRYGEQWADEVGEFLRMMGMIMPITFVWMVYDQQSTEWQDQYVKMWPQPMTPETWSQLPNSILVIIMVWALSVFVYPAFERRGIACTPLRRMAVGSILVTISFALSGALEYKVLARYDGKYDKESGNMVPGSCTNCVNGWLQFPQWFLVSLGESLFSPTGNEFAYTQVGKSMKSFSTAFWLLTVAFGNLIVVVVEESLAHNDTFQGDNTPNKYWLYTAICGASNILFIVLAHFWYKYKPGSVKAVNA
ncbi:hypothetical protein RI367_006093 [Sorochytrium milnesiophthora]